MAHLNSPLRIKNMELANRLVMPPMATTKASADGAVTQALCDYYAEKARGGYVGLVITEHSFIAQQGKAHAGQVSIASDEAVPGFAQLAESIHAQGAKAIAQISHAGAAAKAAVTGCEVIGPSAVRLPRASAEEPLPRAMTTEDMDKVVADFAAAALRVKRAGFDGVEIHSAHSYLLNQFYSPLTNHRDDEYGGSLENRVRLHVRVIRAVREAVGKDCVVALRLGACDYMEGGSTREDGAAAAVIFEREGVDLLDVSGGLCSYVRPGVKEQGYFGELTEAMRARVSVPVLLTGGVTEARAADALLAKADLIGVGRAILKDSQWAEQAMKTIEDWTA